MKSKYKKGMILYDIDMKPKKHLRVADVLVPADEVDGDVSEFCTEYKYVPYKRKLLTILEPLGRGYYKVLNITNHSWFTDVEKRTLGPHDIGVMHVNSFKYYKVHTPSVKDYYITLLNDHYTKLST